MVLAGRQRGDVLAITQHDKTGFFALQELLNHHTRATIVVAYAKLVVEQHEVDGLVCLGRGHRHHHTFASSQAVGLDHNRRALRVHIGMGQRSVGEGLVLRSRNVVALHKCLGESLRAFQLGRKPGGTKHTQAMGPEFVHDTRRQRSFGAHHRQGNFVVRSPGPQFLHIGDGHVLETVVQRRASVARCDINHLHLG